MPYTAKPVQKEKLKLVKNKPKDKPITLWAIFEYLRQCAKESGFLSPYT